MRMRTNIAHFMITGLAVVIAEYIWKVNLVVINAFFVIEIFVRQFSSFSDKLPYPLHYELIKFI